MMQVTRLRASRAVSSVNRRLLQSCGSLRHARAFSSGIPVRVKKTRPNKKIEPRSNLIGTEKALIAAQGPRHGRVGVQCRGVEQWHCAVLGLNKEHDLGAAENDGFRAARDQARDDLAICRA